MSEDFNLSAEEMENQDRVGALEGHMEMEMEDDNFLAAQAEEREEDWSEGLLTQEEAWKEEEGRRKEFQNKLEERMLQLGADQIRLEPSNQEETKVSRLQNVSGFNELLSNPKESGMTEEQLQDVEAGKKEWAKEYDLCIANPPRDGDVLTTLEEGDKVLLTVELNENAPPFIYGRIYVPEIVGQSLGWYLQGSEGQNFHGWKCILLPRARTELIRKFGLQRETMEVASLKMIRESQSGKSILCEVHDYGDVEEVAQEKEAVQEEAVPQQMAVPQEEEKEAVQEVKPDVTVAELQTEG